MGGALRASGVVGNLTGLGWVVAKTSGSGTGKGRGQKKTGLCGKNSQVAVVMMMVMMVMMMMVTKYL